MFWFFLISKTDILLCSKLYPRSKLGSLMGYQYPVCNYDVIGSSLRYRQLPKVDQRPKIVWVQSTFGVRSTLGSLRDEPITLCSFLNSMRIHKKSKYQNRMSIKSSDVKINEVGYIYTHHHNKVLTQCYQQQHKWMLSFVYQYPNN